MTTSMRMVVADLTVNGVHRAGQSSVAFLVPLRTGRGGNDRETPGQRIERVQRERNAVALCWPKHPIPLPCVVTFTRIAPNRAKALDDDNCAAALKACRDEVARLIGVDDADPRIAWAKPSQEVGDWGVWIQIVSELGGPVLVERPRPPRKSRAKSKTQTNAPSALTPTPAFIPPRKP